MAHRASKAKHDCVKFIQLVKRKAHEFFLSFPLQKREFFSFNKIKVNYVRTPQRPRLPRLLRGSGCGSFAAKPRNPPVLCTNQAYSRISTGVPALTIFGYLNLNMM